MATNAAPEMGASKFHILKAAGIAAIPVAPAGKIPVVSGWTRWATGKAIPDDPSLDVWAASPELGVGIPTGVIVGVDIDVLDEDTAPLVKSLAASILGETPFRRIGRAPKELLVYRTDTPRTKAGSAAFEIKGSKCQVEILGDGQQFVAHGIHPDTGNPYTWPARDIVGAQLDEIPTVTAAQLDRFISQAEGLFRDNKGILVANGKAAGQVTERSPVRVPPEGWDDSPEHLAYVRDLLARQPTAVEGAGGDLATFRAGCVPYDYGVSQGAALTLMTEPGGWNARCSPQWDLADLQKKIANAYEYATGEAGAKHPRRQFGGVDVPAANENAETPAAAGRPPLQQHSSAAADIVPRMLIKGLIPRAGVGLLAGQSRAGKTFLALDAMRAVVTGGEFFGHRVRERAGVLYLAAEGSGTIPARVEAVRLKRLGGMAAEDIPFLWGPIASSADIAPYVAEAAASFPQKFGLRLGLVIVDTVPAAYLIDDAQSSAQATKVMKHLETVALAHNTFALGITHFGKDASKGVRDSTAWTGSADIVLAATADISETTGSVKNRKLALTKTRGGRMGPIGGFNFEDVVIGTDEDGEVVSVPVIAATVPRAERATAAPVARPVKLKRVGEVYRDSLRYALMTKGEDVEILGIKVHAVDQYQVQREFAARWNPADAGDPDDSNMRACRRGQEDCEGARVSTCRKVGKTVWVWEIAA